jgi:hypothetical protein
MFDRLSPKQKQVLFAILLSVTTSICKNVTMQYSIEFVDGYYYFHSIDRHLEHHYICRPYIEADIVND